MITTYKWSIDEWHELVDSGVLAGKPVELLEGDIVAMSPEGVEHSYTNRSIVKYLRKLLADQAEVIQAQPITLDNSEPEPDITIVRLPESLYRRRHPYPQDVYWLIEISKRTLQKDLIQKALTYARNGIPEYWVIDLTKQKLIVHTKPQRDLSYAKLTNRYTQVSEYQTGFITPLAFPNISIPLSELLLYA